jgi:hypothetical protein
MFRPPEIAPMRLELKGLAKIQFRPPMVPRSSACQIR